MRDAKVYQLSSADVLPIALKESSCETIVLDLFDDVVNAMPKELGAFLDDFEDDKYSGTKLIIVCANTALIEDWELYNVTYL